MNIGIETKHSEAIRRGLFTLLSNTFVVYVQTQGVHWDLVGAEFYSLHTLTEKQYGELAEAIDEIAERIRALGFFVEGGVAAFLKGATIPTEVLAKKRGEHLSHLLSAHEAIAREARGLGSLAEEARDHGTVDLIGRRLLDHEKYAWMLRAELDK